MRFTIAYMYAGVLVCGSVGRSLPIDDPQQFPKLTSYFNENHGQQGYKFHYALDDGTLREENGSFVNGIWTVVGKVEWVDDDSNLHEVKYITDDKGTRSKVTFTRQSNSESPLVFRLRPETKAALLGSYSGSKHEEYSGYRNSLPVARKNIRQVGLSKDVKVSLITRSDFGSDTDET